MQSATASLAEALDDRLAPLWRVLGRGGGGDGLSRTSLSVLATLRDGGPHRVTRLADAEGVAQPSMTALVIRLERLGLVERGPDPDDARAVRVAITADGLARLKRVREARAAALEARLSALDPGERAALRAALPALDSLISGEASS
ncbi:MAG: hypothetical protein QOD44_535 [Solirubrobacteraceae bacterium]|jgi:DNA-binding MarR family transcriptional regulator|nr:hypothetical protein [Solirubrobacteraceae bacterium]MEA2316346.1 hypothetical protein [Solirubrobacteraceae bacterium]